ncbi:hypothetical protein BEP19_03335 [Ammoniphilus oxalaticus]|uniref:Uncharacterized protein n=1 Tax=Ammoniphilus oxalaticus TaxID=66863 RepID=A0A419SP31_9BACL|nr:hypothetical protein [Ammoniphilus oxalaticus]RKD25971.1 hypothetical protein BEP19_03335 [Ammoniphilus oxalaticus]
MSIIRIEGTRPAELEEQQILEKIENLLLEQQVHTLENTLSDTISFFSTWTAMAGVFLAALLVIAGWIMKRVFDKKLTQVTNISSDITGKFEVLKDVEQKVNSKFNTIQEINEYFIKSKKEWEKIKEIQDFQYKEINIG